MYIYIYIYINCSVQAVQSEVMMMMMKSIPMMILMTNLSAAAIIVVTMSWTACSWRTRICLYLAAWYTNYRRSAGTSHRHSRHMRGTSKRRDACRWLAGNSWPPAIVHQPTNLPLSQKCKASSHIFNYILNHRRWHGSRRPSLPSWHRISHLAPALPPHTYPKPYDSSQSLLGYDLSCYPRFDMWWRTITLD